MTGKKKPPTWIGPDGLPYDEFGVVPTHDYLDPDMARRARELRSKQSSGKRKLSDDQAKQRKIFFINQTRRAKKTGAPLADSLSGNKPTPAPRSTQNDPGEGPAPKKKPKTDFNSPSTSDDEMAALVDQANSQVAEAAMDDPEARVGGGDSVGGGGGGGVGQSTGDWSCETSFGARTIKTIASRHCLCLPRNNHTYKALANITRDINNAAGQPQQSRYFGISTPWNYIDFNQLDVFFSPQQFQYLINNSRRFRPRRFTVEIFNIQVIQKTAYSDVSFNYTNDLTSTIQVFFDAGKRYPILSYPNQSTIMSSFPNDIYKCPQYAYLTDCDTLDNTQTDPIESTISDFSQFYVLDEHESAMLRTGNNWSCTFEFDSDIGWFDNRRSVTQLSRMMNPLYDAYQASYNGNPVHIGSFDAWRQPFIPGPFVSMGSIQGTAGNTPLPAGPDNTTYAQMWGGDRVYIAPGPPVANGEAEAHLQFFPQKTKVAESNTNPGEELNTANLTKAQISPWPIKNTDPVQPWRQPEVNGAANSNNADQRWAGLIPGMVWERRPFTNKTCIWQRVPNVNGTLLAEPQLGGIPTTNAPGHIFVKITPKAVQGPGVELDFVNEMASFTVKISMEWDVEWDKAYNWNPIAQHGINNDELIRGIYFPNLEGEYVCNTAMQGKIRAKH